MYAYLLEVDAYTGAPNTWIMSGAWSDSAAWHDEASWMDVGGGGGASWNDDETWNDAEIWNDVDARSGVETLRLATHTITTKPTETPTNVTYDGRIVEAGAFSKSLISSGRLGRASNSWGFIELANADGGLDAWLDYGFAGRAFALKVLETKGQSVSEATTLFRGAIAALESGSAADTLQLRIRDRLTELQVPLLTTRYAGTSTSGGAGVEGETDLKDQLKPRVFGSVTNIQPKVANQYDLIYQVSSAAVSSIIAYDGADALTNVGNYATVAALLAATVAPGDFATCHALGLFRLGGTPALTVTADVVEAAADLSAAGVVSRILDAVPIAPLDRDLDSFTALGTFNSSTVGLFVDAETTVLDLAGQVLSSIGAAIVSTADGLFQVIGLPAPEDAPPPVVTPWVLSSGLWSDSDSFLDDKPWRDAPLTDASIGVLTLQDLAQGGSFAFGIGPDAAGTPAWSVVLNWGRVWATMTEGQIAGAVGVAQRTYLASQWRQAKSEDATVKTKHPLASQITADTLLTVQADAQAEAARLLGLYSVRRDLLSFPTDADRAPYDLGDVVTVTIPRFGYDNGRLMLVVGKHIDADKRIVTLDLWG